MNLSKLAMPLIGFVVFTWFARAIWESPLWKVAEDIALSLFAMLGAIKIVQDSRKSNLEKKACSKLIEQVSLVVKPDMAKEYPFRRAEIIGWLTGCAALFLMGSALLKIQS